MSSAEPTDADRPRYSVTSLMVYEACPRQYYYQFVRHMPPPRTPGMIRGASIHALIKRHMATEELPRRIDPEVGRMFADFKSSRFNVTPMLSERRFLFPFSDFDVTGRVDLVLPGTDVPYEVVDFKSGRPWDREEAAQHLQLPVYAAAVARLFDVPPDHVAYTYHYLAANRSESFLLTPDDLERVSRRVERVAEGIRDEVFEPTPGCSCFACRWHKKREDRVARRGDGS